jgi:ABC-type antimicrobial peptide transport system permease subunit
VADSRYFALDETPRPFAYFPLGTDPISTGVLLVRSTVGPNTIVPSIREEVAKIRPTTPVGEITTMAQMVDMHLGRGRFLAFNAAVFSILAISAAAGGLFGSISQLIRRRRREIGTRLALGATALESTWPLLRQAIILTSAGLVCGVALGWIAKTLLIDHIYRLSIGALEPIVAGAVLLLIVLAGSIAPPLTRACRLSPSILLRVE